ALGPSDGAIIHCGTGSFFGFQRARTMRFAGGWGSIIGDEASAKWLGWSALNRALRTVDGTLPSSTFAQSLVDDLGGIDPVLQFAASATPEEFGALAPRVTEAASAGSSFAQAILRDGAHHVASAVTALGWQETMPLCLTGGVAIHYRDYLPASVARALRDPLGEPINGALSLAKEVANGSL
ncbi:MAG: BadF/BadG/BcrA/BcrD ATPase family protein, partial [Pseudomonadota bacterium]